jgi:hypothetical protein
VVTPKLNEQGVPLTKAEIKALGDEFHWSEVFLDRPSKYAWPEVLAEKLNMPVVNHARRGSCFQQISRQCAVAAEQIQQGDVVIIMWTYLSRLSLQWPARTTVPFANFVEPEWGWRTVVAGFNKKFGLDRNTSTSQETEERIEKYIHDSVKYTYLDTLGVFNRYYNSLILQVMTDGFIRSRGAEVLHLSVEPESALRQLEIARLNLDTSLREPYVIPDPSTWYNLLVDHDCSHVMHDPSLPPAENDTHPGVLHHQQFADYIYRKHFVE